MPELPEVEITTKKLRPLIVGKRILNFNEKILDLERRGKAILIHLSGGRILGFHQRMTGKLIIVDRDFKNKYIRRRFRLSGGKDLALHDVRKFGVVWYGASKKVLDDNYFRTLGPDALSISFQEFKNILARRQNLPLTPSFVRRGRITPLISLTLRGTQKQNTLPSYDRVSPLALAVAQGGRVGIRGFIKLFLLNQQNLAGVGNIMADEILWHAKINPKREVRSLREREVRNLWSSLRAVLKRSIKLGGSTMRDWFHPDGGRGGYFEKRFIYDREGEKCFRCKAEIIRKKIAGRSSYYCEKCQAI